MARYFIEVAYKGTAYSGFQIQENAVTIQSEVETAFSTLYRHSFHFTGSSRTDAGVHALQNYFHFDYEGELHPQTIYKLNAILSRDIVVRSIQQMPQNAHSRFDATSREYMYRLHTFKSPFLSDTSFYYPYRLNIELLQQGALHILKQQNFFAFCKTNTQVTNFECRILKSRWMIDGEQLSYNIEGNRFLRGMVRLLTATLLKLGRGDIAFPDFEHLFVSNHKAGFSIPPQGLHLLSVRYPQGYFGDA